MGSWETSVNANFFMALSETEISFLVAGAGKSVLWYVKLFIFLPGELICWQLHNHPGHRCYEESRACVTGVLLLRF